MNDCGHTDEEHEESARQETELVMEGNLAPLFARMEEEQLTMNLQALYSEVFIRSGDDETFEENVRSIHDRVLEVLLRGETAPAIREQLVTAREQLIKENEGAVFMEEAEDELRIMLEQHGVVQEPEPVDEQFGFYL